MSKKDKLSFKVNFFFNCAQFKEICHYAKMKNIFFAVHVQGHQPHLLSLHFCGFKNFERIQKH